MVYSGRHYRSYVDLLRGRLPPPAYGQSVVASVYYPLATTESDRTLRLIAFIFCLISTISVGWTIIPLAWMIPMSVHCWGVYQGTKPNTVAFGVCALIFVTVVGGILLLVSKTI